MVAIPARFAARTNVLRYRAEVAARALVEAVYRAGGEPWIMHPDTDEAERRLARADALLLPGGGDVAPHRYGGTAGDHPLYDVDDEQDAFDIAAARYAIATGMPTLAICRGLQIVNVVLGGTLRWLGEDHLHLVHPVALAAGSALAAARGTGKVEASCYHRQCVDRLGEDLVPVAWAADGTIEAIHRTAPGGWLMAVQWHPEDLPDQWLFDALAGAAR
ncbi:type 1 glutamine amidotransferase [Micromonospora sp. CPCC 206061]